MALKDWKKTINLKGIIQWDSKVINREIAITNFDFDEDWTIILKKEGEDIENLATNKSKSQALAYAKQYMRTH